MKQDKIIEFGLLVPILTVITIAAVYSYEFGYFSFFGIPTDFIEIELTKSILIFFAFLPLLLVLYSILLFFFMQLVIFKHFRKILPRILLGIGFILCLYFLVPGIKSLIFHKEIGLFIFSFVIGLVFLPVRKDEDEYLFHLPILFPSIKPYAARISKAIGVSLIFSSIFCIIMFSAGRLSGELKSSFYTKNNNRTVLLRKYSSLEIYGLADSTEVTFKVFVITTGSNNDTFRLRAK